MKQITKTALMLSISICATSQAYAALVGCGNSGASFVRGVKVVEYPQDFCESGLGIVLPTGPLERHCVQAINTKTQLTPGRSYKMCLFETVNAKFIIAAAEDTRAE